jgi:hypothetical protein
MLKSTDEKKADISSCSRASPCFLFRRVIRIELFIRADIGCLIFGILVEIIRC